MALPLTKRQREIFDYIDEFSKAKGYAPSLQEIKDQFNLKAISTVHEHLENLKAKGYIKKEMNQARGIQVCNTKGSNRTIDAVNIRDNEDKLTLDCNLIPAKLTKILFAKNSAATNTSNEILVFAPKTAYASEDTVVCSSNGRFEVSNFPTNGTILGEHLLTISS